MVNRPAPYPLHERDRDGLDDLEELGDDAIISQQTAAHAPKPRAKVADEARSVVIKDESRPGQQVRRAAPKSSAEATVVIRDRRALHELRASIKGGSQKAKRRRALYRWAGLGLAAFVLGGVVAFLASDTHSDQSPPLARVEAQLAPLRVPSRTLANQGPVSNGPPPAAPPEAQRAVRLDDLPLESAARTPKR